MEEKQLHDCRPVQQSGHSANTEGIKSLIVRITMSIMESYDTSQETVTVRLTVPKGLSYDKIRKILSENAEWLDQHEGTGPYATYGRSPETLLAFTCKQQEWSWTHLAPMADIDLYV